jgi:hypothetical protein
MSPPATPLLLLLRALSGEVGLLVAPGSGPSSTSSSPSGLMRPSIANACVEGRAIDAARRLEGEYTRLQAVLVISRAASSCYQYIAREQVDLG